MVKNSILTLVGISTLTNWLLFVASQSFTGGNGIFPSLDFINCVVIALMFRYNERYYKKCCKCCIVLCFMDCDRAHNHGDQAELKVKQQYVDDYLNNIQPMTPSVCSKTTLTLSPPGPAGNIKHVSSMSSMTFSDIGSNDGIVNSMGLHIKLSDIVGDIELKDCAYYGVSPRDVINTRNNQDKDKVDPSNHAYSPKGNHDHPQHLSMAHVVTNTAINDE